MDGIQLPQGSLLFTTKFPEIPEYNLRKIFLEKSYAKCGEETVPRPFSKKSELSISLDQYFQVLYSLFSLFAKLGLSKLIETRLQTTCI